MLDLTLDRGKNIVDDALHLAIRIDTDKIPGSLLRAYTQIEIDARAQATRAASPPRPSGRKPRRPPRLARRGRGRRRPVPAANSLSGPLGRADEHPLRRQRQHDRPGSPPGPVPRDVRPVLEPITAGSLAQSSRRPGGRPAGGA